MHKRSRLLIAILVLLSPRCFAQWQMQAVNTTASFRSLSIAGPDVVWIGGTKGTFVRTADGGKTWQTGTIPDAQTCDFRDVKAIDAQTAYYMSAGQAEQGNARIYKTTNGGQSWTLLYQTQQKGVFFDSMDFWDANHGIAVSDPIDGRWFIVTTDDGGKTWTPVPPTALPLMEPNEAAFAASGTNVAVQGKRHVWIASGGSSYGRVFRSSDRGKTWAVSVTPIAGGTMKGLVGMQFFSEKAGMVVGGSYQPEPKPGPAAAITRDGGQTWQLVAQTDPPGLKESVALLPGDRLLLVGPTGSSLSADQGQTWQKLDAESFHSVACVKGTCYVVGEKGRVAKQVFR